MNIHNLLSRCAIAVVPFLMASSFVSTAQAEPSVAWRYDFVKIDYPHSLASFPLGINSKRQIIGVRVDTNGVNHGYLYQNGKFTDIDYPGASQIPGGGTFTGGINDDGDVAGLFTDGQRFQHGFVRTAPDGCLSDWDTRCKPVYRQIDVPGAAQTKDIFFETGTGLGTAAIGIDNQQTVVGIYATQGLYSVGFALSHGRFTTIDDPASGHTPGNGSRVFAVNDFGAVAGAYSTQASPTAPQINGGFLFNGYEYIPVNVPGSEKGGFGTQANGVNNRQEVVGVFSDPQGTFHGLVWTFGQSFILDYPNAPYSECHSINAQGDITGAYITDLSGANYRGFVAFLKNDR